MADAMAAARILDTAPDAAFDRIRSLVCRALDVPFALVSLTDADRSWFTSRAGISVGELSREVAFCAHAIQSDQPLLVQDALDDPRFANDLLVVGPPYIRACAGAPLRTPEGEAIGALCALDTRTRRFDREQIAALTDLAAVAGSEARAMHSEQALRHRVRILEAILNAAGEAILVVDRTGDYQIFNDTTSRLLGRRPDEVAPLDRARVYGLFEADRVTPMSLDRLPLVRAVRGEAVQRETIWLCNDAHPGGVDLLATAHPLYDEAGASVGAVGTFADVSALKTIEAELARSQAALADRVEVLEAILESAGEGVIVADETGRLLVVNPFARQLIGRGPSDTAPSEAWMRNAGIYRADTRTLLPADELPLQLAIRGQPTDRLEVYVQNERFPDGRFLQVTGRPLRYSDGRPRGGVVVLSDITPLKRAQEQVQELALTDELTGLPNRRAFRERLDMLTREAARGRRFALTLVDVDHFKQINDVHGHEVGDQVLITVARALEDHSRCCDLVGRIGGEEFCLLQADVTDQAMALAERLRAVVEAIRKPLLVTASFGVCHSGLVAPEAMLRAADQALYRAKREGRNRVALAAPDLQSSGRQS